MHRRAIPHLSASGARHAQNRVAAQVRVDGGRGANVVRLVGHAHVLRARVGVRVDGDGLDAEAAARAHHATRNLAAVGDEHLFN